MSHRRSLIVLASLLIVIASSTTTAAQETAAPPPSTPALAAPAPSPSDLAVPIDPDPVAPADPAGATPADPDSELPALPDAPPQLASALAELPATQTPVSFRRSMKRLARMPAMFGDVFSGGGIVAQTNVNFVAADLALAGGSRRAKVAEQNKALPVDRFTFIYNHFHNALQLDRSLAPGAPPFYTEAQDVNRYTFAVEKTFGCGLWSVELRMPFTSDTSLQSRSPMAPATPDFEMDSGNIGNLAVILKGLLWETETTALSAGLGIDTPTGSDVVGRLPLLALPVEFEVRNESVHLQPFVACSLAPHENFYCHMFVQLDVAANGNTVLARNALGPVAEGRLDEQTLLYVDGSLGYWLYRNECGPMLKGLAATAELHYTSTLRDADIVPLGPLGAFGAGDNRFDILNLTAGLHAELFEQTNLRAALVLPAREGDDQFFDAEIIAALTHRF